MQDRSSVLVVEDDFDICESIREELEEAGYVVTIAISVKEARACLRRGLRPAVMLVDYMLKDGSGAELVDECRRDPSLREIPVVMMSASRPTEMANDGFQRYLQKPFHPDELRAELTRVLRKAG